MATHNTFTNTLNPEVLFEKISEVAVDTGVFSDALFENNEIKLINIRETEWIQMPHQNSQQIIF